VHSNSGCEHDIASSLDRARVYGVLSRIFRAPDGESIEELRARGLRELCQALGRLTSDSSLLAAAKTVQELFDGRDEELLRHGFHDAFDESSGRRCVPNEMDQLNGAPQLELTRNFEMADVSGFFRAFGVEASPACERVDHISAELEFMHLLAVKEAVSLHEEGAGEHSEVCRDAARSFMRDHLGRWAPHFGESLVEQNADPVYAAAGRLLGGFVEFDSAAIEAAQG
jgi:TorA maturation chaperone TorD